MRNQLRVLQMYKVYKITNKINGKFYIGYTKLPIEKRWKLHANNASSRMVICRSIQKYGSENFTIELLEEFSTKREAVEREIELISELTPEYNIHHGGTGGPMYGPMNGMYGKNHTDEWKQNKSLQMLGANNPMYGKTHSDEVKALLSELKKGKPSHNKGKKMSEEQKDKLRKPKTEECKQKLRKVYSVDDQVITNAKQFCKEKSYNYVCFTQAAKKGIKYKGHVICVLQ